MESLLIIFTYFVIAASWGMGGYVVEVLLGYEVIKQLWSKSNVVDRTSCQKK